MTTTASLDLVDAIEGADPDEVADIIHQSPRILAALRVRQDMAQPICLAERLRQRRVALADGHAIGLGMLWDGLQIYDRHDIAELLRKCGIPVGEVR